MAPRFHFRLPLKTFLVYARFRRAMTLGVRAMVLDDGGRVLLVRHSYTPGWSLPGGGVEPGETLEDALHRELMEEGGIALDRRPEFFGVYLNRNLSRRDHVGLFVCREWGQARELRLPNLEIVDCAFFAAGALPEETTPATRRRLAEVLEGVERSPEW